MLVIVFLNEGALSLPVPHCCSFCGNDWLHRERSGGTEVCV